MSGISCLAFLTFSGNPLAGADAEQEQSKDPIPVQDGMDGIALIVNSKNPVQTLTKQQVQEIYSGKITNWKELGGHDAPIAVFGSEEGPSTANSFLNHFDLEDKQIVQPNGTVRKLFRTTDAQEYSKVEVRLIRNEHLLIAMIGWKSNAIAYASDAAEGAVRTDGPVRLVQLDGSSY